MAIFFGYDSKSTQDGSGAQVQRIFAIYSLAKFIGVKYVNQQVIEIDFNPGDGINTPIEMREYVTKLNNFLSFLNEDEPINPILKSIGFSGIFKSKILSVIFFGLKKIQSQIIKRDYLYLISNPYPLINRHPDAYESFKSIAPSLEDKINEEKISIQLHVGRAKTSETHMPERFTPDEWYMEILDELISAVTAAGKEYEILIHTDVSEEKIWEVPTGANRETLKYWKNSGIIDDEGRLELQGSTVLIGFKKYENLSFISNIDPISAWQVMSKADFLLIGKSSFSFIGALLNGKGVVISPVFWSKGPKSWLVFKESKEIHDHSFNF